MSKSIKNNLNQYNKMTQPKVYKYRGKSLNDYNLLKKSVWEKAHQLKPEDKLKFINNLKKDLKIETKIEEFNQSYVNKQSNKRQNRKVPVNKIKEYDGEAFFFVLTPIKPKKGIKWA
jgi:hypothetical protein